MKDNLDKYGLIIKDGVLAFNNQKPVAVETYLEKNIEFLAKVNLQGLFDDRDNLISDLMSLYYDLFDALQIDDSVVMELTKDSTVDYKKIKETESIVRKFNTTSKFLTLIDKHEEALTKVLGKDTFRNKIDIAKRNKWK